MAKRPDAYLRAFGMTGLQLIDDLGEIEISSGYDLGMLEKPKASRAIEGYDQFSETVRKQAATMSEYFEIFYCLENTIRDLVTNILKDDYSADWWDEECVKPNIRSEVKSRQKKEADSAVSPRSDRQIDYTTFGELSQLITDNWPLFEPIFNSKAAVSRVMNELNVLRGPIAHCCDINEHEQERLRFAVKNWLRIVS